MFKIHYFTGHFIQKRYLSLVFYDNRTLKISKSKKSEQYFRDKSEIFISLLDEHFVRHFESHWRETWRHTGRWTVPQISLETPSPLPPPPRVGPILVNLLSNFNAMPPTRITRSTYYIQYMEWITLTFWEAPLIAWSFEIFAMKPFRWIEQMEQQYLRTVIWLSWTTAGFTTDILQSPYHEKFYKNMVMICCSNLFTRPT